ncbi:hypothetical protein AB0G92_32460, partial [Streptomyces californicus]
MSLPGADELFRTTGGGMGLQPSSPAERRRKANGEPRVPAPAGESDPSGPAPQPGRYWTGLHQSVLVTVP